MTVRIKEDSSVRLDCTYHRPVNVLEELGGDDGDVEVDRGR